MMIRYLWASPNSLIGLLFALSACGNGAGAAIVNGVLEVHSPLTAWVLRHWTLVRGGAWALTLGHVVLGRDEEALASTRRHERVHVRQYERWGPIFIPAYLVASVWSVLRGGRAYEGNAFEREAVELAGGHYG